MKHSVHILQSDSQHETDTEGCEEDVATAGPTPELQRVGRLQLPLHSPPALVLHNPFPVVLAVVKVSSSVNVFPVKTKVEGLGIISTVISSGEGPADHVDPGKGGGEHPGAGVQP